MSTSPDDSADQFTQALAACLKAIKDASPYSVRSLAKAVGIGDATVRRYLDGEREIPTSMLRRIAQVLEVSPSAVMDEAEASVLARQQGRRADSE